MAAPTAVYRSRNSQATDYYRCVEDHLETFVRIYEERFERTYGFFLPYLQICPGVRTAFANPPSGS